MLQLKVKLHYNENGSIIVISLFTYKYMRISRHLFIYLFLCFFVEKLTDSIKSVLGRHTKILVKYMVKLEYKTDKTENRVLVSFDVITGVVTREIPINVCVTHTNTYKVNS